MGTDMAARTWLAGMAVAVVLAAAPGLALDGGFWHAVLHPDGRIEVANADASYASCTGFAPLDADCATGAGITPFALTLGWPACTGPVSTPFSNCFAGDMLDVLTYQEPEQRQLVFKCSAIYLGVVSKMYDYACFAFGPWLFDVPFEHTCHMRAYGSTFAAGAPLGLPGEGVPGAAGAWLCGVSTFEGWG